MLDAFFGAILCGGLFRRRQLVQTGSRPRRHGIWRRQDDVYGWYFFGIRGALLTILFGTLLGTIIGVGVITVLFASGWKSALARRANKMDWGA